MLSRHAGLRLASLTCAGALLLVACRSSPPHAPVDPAPSAPLPVPPPPPPPASAATQAPPPPADNSADVTAIESYVRAHADSVRRECWTTRQKAVKLSHVSVTVTVNIDGQVTKAKASGTERSIERCIEDHIKRWHFPAVADTLTVSMPFKFRQ